MRKLFEKEKVVYVSIAIMYVGDNLIKGQTIGDESHTQQKTQREKVKKDLYKIAIKTILKP